MGVMTDEQFDRMIKIIDEQNVPEEDRYLRFTSREAMLEFIAALKAIES